MSEPFLGQIMMVGFTFPPRGWAQCDGQLLPIVQNQALFSILGTTYGGDGRTTFALPELRGRTPIHEGQGPGLSPRTLGEKSGEENHTLTADEGPAHTHDVMATNTNATSDDPQGKLPAVSESATYGMAGTMWRMSSSAMGMYPGGNQPHVNMQPYLTINFCIALQGLFPTRN